MSDSKSETNSEGELRKAAREYAWDWFEFHANQRQQSFRFYLTLIGALLAAYYVATRMTFLIKGRQEVYFPTFDPCPFLISLLGVVISILFYRLDRRNRILVRYAEDALRGFEVDFALKLDPNCSPNFVRRASDPAAHQPGYVKWFTTYGDIYRWLYFVGGIAALAGLNASWPAIGLKQALRQLLP